MWTVADTNYQEPEFLEMLGLLVHFILVFCSSLESYDMMYFHYLGVER